MKKQNQVPVCNPQLVNTFEMDRYIDDQRIYADRHVFAFDGDDPEQGGKHEWRCSFWVRPGSPIPNPKAIYKSKSDAIADGKLK